MPGGGSDEQPANGSWRMGELQTRSEPCTNLDIGVLLCVPTHRLRLGQAYRFDNTGPRIRLSSHGGGSPFCVAVRNMVMPAMWGSLRGASWPLPPLPSSKVGWIE